MGEETSTTPPHHVPLNVLPHSGKVDQLRKEVMDDAQQAKAESSIAVEGGTVSSAPALPLGPGGVPTNPQPAAQTPRQRDIERKVIGVLRSIFDPEIPVNIYELGLIYEIKVDETDAVNIKMTLTSPACPVAGSLPGEVETKVEAIPEVRTANIDLVWEPTWSKDMMSESAMLDLGFL